MELMVIGKIALALAGVMFVGLCIADYFSKPVWDETMTSFKFSGKKVPRYR